MFDISFSYENILLVVANVINFIYNVPQVLRTYRTKSAGDFDIWFLGLRVFYNFLWILYGIEINSWLVCLNSVVTIIATMFIGYYKVMGENIRVKNRVVPVADERDVDGEHV